MNQSSLTKAAKMLGLKSADDLEDGLVALIKTVEQCVATVNYKCPDIDVELETDALAMLVTFYQLRYGAAISDLLERVGKLERESITLEDDENFEG